MVVRFWLAIVSSLRLNIEQVFLIEFLRKCLYRVSFTEDRNSDHHQIIAENCSIASSVSDNEVKLEKIPLLINRCPSLDSRLSVRFQRIDPDHLKSTTFQMRKFETTSIVYLRCSVGICYGRIENCQEVISFPTWWRSICFSLASLSRNSSNISITTRSNKHLQFLSVINNRFCTFWLRRWGWC